MNHSQRHDYRRKALQRKRGMHTRSTIWETIHITTPSGAAKQHPIRSGSAGARGNALGGAHIDSFITTFDVPVPTLYCFSTLLHLYVNQSDSASSVGMRASNAMMHLMQLHQSTIVCGSQLPLTPSQPHMSHFHLHFGCSWSRHCSR